MDSTVSAAIIIGICGIIGAALAAIVTYYLTNKSAHKRYVVNKSEHSGITYSSRSCNYGEKALQAKNSIFSSSIFMAMLADYDIQNDFANVNPEIPITLVMVNSDYPDMLKFVNMFNGRSNIENEEKVMTTVAENVKIGIKRIKSSRNINVKFINFIVPVSYFAVDYKIVTESSFIQIKHYLLNDKRAVKVLYCTVLPGSELFEQYRKQILLLERSDENFSNCFNVGF